MKSFSFTVCLFALGIFCCQGAFQKFNFKDVPISFFEGVGPSADTFVTIKNGTLKGKTGTTMGGFTSYNFLSIPYAEPPVGLLRFKAPKPYDNSWSDVRVATKFPPSCPQHDPALTPASEDCLYLNVYTTHDPATDAVSNLPVMVFVHGGGFASGESTYYSGSKLLIQPGVVVILHYRLGPLGFLSTNDAVSPGNYGLKDVVQALRWVQENIPSFGGDPDNVTIMGESAGGATSIYMLLSPLARGLFHKVIAQSGSAISEWALDRKPEESSKKLADLVGCPNATSSQLVNCLRTIPWETLAQVSHDFQNEAYANLNLGLDFTTPTVEPDLPGAFITKEPLEIMETGDLPDVPVILGTTLHEGSYTLGLLYQAKLGPEGLVNDTKWMRDESIPALLGAFGVEENTATGALSESVALAYMPGSNRENFTEIMPYMVDMMSVFFMKASVLKTADILSTRLSNVYLYSMEQYSKNSMWFWLYLGEDPPPITPGITHADDLMYIFAMPVIPGPSDTAFSRIMSKIWNDFATTGVPVPEARENVPVWPKYTVHTQDYYRLNSTSFVDASYHSSWIPRGFEPR